jgi:hypothetical protein
LYIFFSLGQVKQDAKIKELCLLCEEGKVEEVKKFIKDELYLGAGLDLIVMNGQDYNGILKYNYLIH